MNKIKVMMIWICLLIKIKLKKMIKRNKRNKEKQITIIKILMIKDIISQYKTNS